MKVSEQLGSKLRVLREINNYTQEYVADALNISSSTYSLMEKGQATFTVERLEKLALLYKLDIVDILNMSGQTIIHQITHTHSSGICSDNVNINNNNGLAEEERNLYKETIARLEEQNNKLMILLDKLSDKLD